MIIYIRNFILLIMVILSLSCTAYMNKIKLATVYNNSGNYDEALKVLEDEFNKNPNRSELRVLLFRAKLNSYYMHLSSARNFIKIGNSSEAKKEYERVLSIFPGNKRIQEEMISNLAEPKSTETKEISYVQNPIELNTDPQKTINLNLSNMPIRTIFSSLGKSVNINFVFEKDLQDSIQSINVQNKTFLDILHLLCMMANAEYRVVDPNTIFIFPDLPQKKMQFDLRGIKVFYLSNIKAEDAKKTLTPIFMTGGQLITIQEDPNLNALIVKADYTILSEIEKFINNIDLQKSEVEINVEIMEINRNIINRLGVNYGTTPPTITTAATTGGEDKTASDNIPINEIANAQLYLTLPSIALNFLESSDNSRLIAKPNLRGLDGMEISYMVGDEVPIPRTTFTSVAAGGVNNVPLTNYDYKNVGVEIKLTPFIHQNNEITLKIKLTINFISGSGYENLPTLGKREIEANICLKEDETSIIGGFIRDDVRRSLGGFPALSKIPIIGRLFSSSEKTINQTDLIFSITPRIIRKMPIQEKNQKPIWLNLNPPPTASTGNLHDRSNTSSGDSGHSSSGEQRNSLIIVPRHSRIPDYSEVTLNASVASEFSISSLSIRGSFSDNCEILELKTNLLDDSVKTLQNIYGNSFDAGFTFTQPRKRINTPLLQIRVKFPSKGKYTFTLECSNGFDSQQQTISLSPASAEIEVL